MSSLEKNPIDEYYNNIGSILNKYNKDEPTKNIKQELKNIQLFVTEKEILQLIQDCIRKIDEIEKNYKINDKSMYN